MAEQYRKRYNSAVEHHINPRTGSVVIHTPKDPRTGTFRQREVHPDTEPLDDKVVEPELDVRQETES